ncbi:uncharacterized protein VTP21DRAFT_3987 [Calcarisporiella thermophila]|uniref:uncharacterized protein n=1 Tax=Calcarisporiella thermophila TaxID=911321 RepID=UPI003743EFEA
MVFGKLYTYPHNPRVAKILITAKYSGAELEIDGDFEMGKTNYTKEFLAKFPLGKVPAFEGADGLKLFESSAIAFHVANSKDNNPLLGRDKQEASQIWQWILYSENEFNPHISAWSGPLMGYMQYNEFVHQKAITALKRALASLDKHLASHTYMVGESITLADIAVFTSLKFGFQFLFEEEFRKDYQNVTRHFTMCKNIEQFKSVVGEFELCKETMKPANK